MFFYFGCDFNMCDFDISRRFIVQLWCVDVLLLLLFVWSGGCIVWTYFLDYMWMILISNYNYMLLVEYAYKEQSYTIKCPCFYTQFVNLIIG